MGLHLSRTKEHPLLKKEGDRVGITAAPTPGEKGKFDWIVVPGATIALLGLGVLYSWGTLSVYVSAPGYLAETPSSLTVYCFALAGGMFPFMMILGTYLQKFMSPVIVTLIAAALVCSGWILSAFVNTLPALLLTWGIIGGAGVPLGFVCGVVVPQQWYPKNAGTVSGITLSGFGLGSFLFNVIIKHLANPNMVPTKPPKGGNASEWASLFHAEMIKNVPNAMIVVGCVAGALIAIGALTLRRPPAPPKIAAPLPSYMDKQGTAVAQAPTVKINYTPGEMVATKQFWILLAAFSGALGAGLFTLGSFGSFAVHSCTFTPPYDLVGGLGAVANALGRLFWGRMCDLTNFRKCLIAQAAGMALLLLFYFETRTNVYLYTAVTTLLFFCFGGVPAIFPIAAGETFGPENKSKNYSVLNIAFAVASVGQALILHTIISMFGSYRLLFYSIAVVSCAAATLVSFSNLSMKASPVKKQQPHDKRKPKWLVAQP